jgi:hypothetical protein
VCSCFDRLSTNGLSSTIITPAPFALSLSKGEQHVFTYLGLYDQEIDMHPES